MSTRVSSANVTMRALAAGVGIGALYTLSPVTVLALGGGGLLAWRLSRDLGPDERRWFCWMLGIALALRLVLIAALFATTSADRPFTTFFWR